jgi:uncharacterized protein (DUF885 family)
MLKQDLRFRAFLEKLAQIDKSELNGAEQISFFIQQRQLQNYIDLFSFNDHYMRCFENSVKAFIHISTEDSIFFAPFNNIESVSVALIQQQVLRNQASSFR